MNFKVGDLVIFKKDFDALFVEGDVYLIVDVYYDSIDNTIITIRDKYNVYHSFVGDYLISNGIVDIKTTVIVQTPTFMHNWKRIDDGVNPSVKFNPLDVQSGGSHYKNRGIQPIEYSMKNDLNFCKGNVVKYITRHETKNKLEDLEKVIHYTLLESFFVYGEEGSTDLKNRILKLLGEVQ